MSVARNSSGSSPRRGGRSTPDILGSGSDDGRFFQTLREFIDHEKRLLRCSEDGRPHELRYVIYRTVFSQVIARATAYKRLLLTIKAEYDDVIRALQRREDEARTAQRSLAASTSHSKSLTTCQRRAAQLRQRISVLQRETAELQEEIQRQKSSKEQTTWIPGLTVAESEDPDALDGHLKSLEDRRAALLDRKRHCVPLEVKAELDAELQAAERHRDQLSLENARLKVLFQRLRFVSDRLSSWEDEEQPVPLEELLGSTLENVRRTGVTDDDARSIDAELFEDEEPTGVSESGLLADCLDRFIELFDSAQYEEAALLAARSPRGVLRNLHTVEMFKGVKGPPGSVPPLLLFLQALLMTVPAGDELPAALSLQVVRRALRHGATRLVAHAVTHSKLTFSEALGDILSEHAQKHPGAADMCLALATVVYEACRLHRKSALSMCRRGLIHSAVDFMKHCEDLTAEDCMWVLCRSPGLSLLQLLTEPQRGQAAILSVGVALSTLLADPQLQDLALQLLDGLVSRGPGVLEEAILEDSSCSVDLWTDIASLCSELNRADLGRAVRSVLLDQSGTRVLSPDLEGARLMEHVFL
ncbi:clathrin heavy chain linker domain-containing protein 1-like [Micropterus salmoides]|uniref:clathrin heavy chain linker domain-containing protein 1-like n=1 Tax=Micropterus salmoides TaxID=27706 RepID=UPI0018EDBF65|nr:clathrin heavy chain linker domain-containing protein 1-like [Micropterus salmoides]XP_038586260.1 clathrin heavy chain linker domain-containing protein 1-like [Micropterus salmoides]